MEKIKLIAAGAVVSVCSVLHFMSTEVGLTDQQSVLHGVPG